MSRVFAGSYYVDILAILVRVPLLIRFRNHSQAAHIPPSLPSPLSIYGCLGRVVWGQVWFPSVMHAQEIWSSLPRPGRPKLTEGVTTWQPQGRNNKLQPSLREGSCYCSQLYCCFLPFNLGGWLAGRPRDMTNSETGNSSLAASLEPSSRQGRRVGRSLSACGITCLHCLCCH